MPEEMNEVFREAGVSLFPEKAGDLTAECSCPDWITPCKHVAAVNYLLAEELDRDAFLIFRLRGIERAEFANLAGAAGSNRDSGESGAGRDTREPPLHSEAAWKTLDPTDGEERAAGYADESPAAQGSLLEQLGSFPFWRGGEDLVSALEEVQRQASPLGLAISRGSR